VQSTLSPRRIGFKKNSFKKNTDSKKQIPSIDGGQEHAGRLEDGGQGLADY
jgi:hypothetical protein